MEKNGILNHVWLIEFDETSITAKAFDENGKEIDSFSKALDKPTKS